MRILVVEDEPAVAEVVRRGLEAHGYAVVRVDTAAGALRELQRGEFAAVVLDLMLPDRSGLDVVREARARGWRVPILALTARGALEDRVRGLEAGCDDYLPKPFAFQELLARLRAIIRRAEAALLTPLEYRGLRLDPASRSVFRDGRRIELSAREFQLLELLLRHPEQVLSRQEIMLRVWGYDLETSSNVLEVYMNFLRRKIDRGFPTRLLHTVRGVGYVLREGEV